MTEVKVELPDELAAEIARRAAALGTTAEEWVAAVVQDVVADLPEAASSPVEARRRYLRRTIHPVAVPVWPAG
jgi:hypothetical protein